MSEQQSFTSHGRYVPGFHFVASFILLANLVYSFVHLARHPLIGPLAQAATSVALLLLWWYVRAFAAANQDRIIRLEERLRLDRVLPADLKARAHELSTPQLVGLRFASDEELPDLVRQTLEKQLTRKDIKSAVKQWRADHHRV